MLVIRQTQMDAMAQPLREAFEQRMVLTFGDALVVRVGTGAGRSRLDLVREGIARAARYGIREETDVAAFLGFMATEGPDFDTQRWARRILGDVGASVTLRLDMLRARCAQRAGG